MNGTAGVARSPHRRVIVGPFAVDDVSMDLAVSRCRGLVQAATGGRVVAVNATKLGARHPDVVAAASSADLVIADGVGALWAARRSGQVIGERVAGADLAVRLLAAADSDGWRVWLHGGRPGVAQRAWAASCRRPAAGISAGYGPPPLDRIRGAKPQLVLLGLGSPRQEQFMLAHEIPGALVVGVGGTFDVLAGDVARAPALLRNAGLEWAWRLGRQPHRLKSARMLDLLRFLVQQGPV